MNTNIKSTVKVLIIFLIIILAGLTGLIYFTQVDNNNKIDDLNSRIDNQESEIARLAGEKESIRKIWQDQVFENNELVEAQENLIFQLEDYLSTIDRSLSTETGIEILPEADSARLNKIRQQLDLELGNVEEVTTRTVNAQESNQQKINQAYSISPQN